jgi:hypothetical protein
MKRLFAVLLGFSLLAATPATESLEQPVERPVVHGSEAPTQVCGWYFTEGCAFTWHKLQGPAGDGYEGLHGDCAYCLTGQGSYDCHPSCLPAEEEEKVVLAYAEALEALAIDDRVTLVRLAEVIPQYVTFNANRGAIQILDCEKNLVLGSFSVATE